MLDTRAFDVVRYLARLPLFSDIGDEALQHLAAGSSLRSIERGQPVFRQGEPCEHFHVVAGGQVKLFVISPAGQAAIASYKINGEQLFFPNAGQPEPGS